MIQCGWTEVVPPPGAVWKLLTILVSPRDKGSLRPRGKLLHVTANQGPPRGRLLFLRLEVLMAISSISAMRRMCELKQWTITNLEANKLLYFAQMLALGHSNGVTPLIAERFQAWDYGPVLPSAYHHAKIFGSKPIRPFMFSGSGPVEGWEHVFEETLKEVGNLTSYQLVAESHWKDGAWAHYYRPGSKGVDIPNDAILQEYRARLR